MPSLLSDYQLLLQNRSLTNVNLVKCKVKGLWSPLVTRRVLRKPFPHLLRVEIETYSVQDVSSSSASTPSAKGMFLELCAGSAMLSKCFHEQGFTVMPVDHQQNRFHPLSKICNLSLTLDSSRKYLYIGLLSHLQFYFAMLPHRVGRVRGHVSCLEDHRLFVMKLTRGGLISLLSNLLGWKLQ